MRAVCIVEVGCRAGVVAVWSLLWCREEGGSRPPLVATVRTPVPAEPHWLLLTALPGRNARQTADSPLDPTPAQASGRGRCARVYGSLWASGGTGQGSLDHAGGPRLARTNCHLVPFSGCCRGLPWRGGAVWGLPCALCSVGGSSPEPLPPPSTCPTNTRCSDGIPMVLNLVRPRGCRREGLVHGVYFSRQVSFFFLLGKRRRPPTAIGSPPTVVGHPSTAVGCSSSATQSCA